MTRIIFIAFFLIIFTSKIFSQINVENITITGNDYLTRTEISNMMITRKNTPLSIDQFMLDLKTIRERYKINGYLYMKFIGEQLKFSDDSAFADITLDISEGEVIDIGKINIKGNKSISTDKILSKFETKEGDNLNDAKLNRDIVALLKIYEKSGLPFARITVDDISIYKTGLPEKDKIKIDLNVIENSRITIDQVRIKGNETTKEYVITRELNLDENRTVDTESLLAMKEKLDRLNIFEFVADPKVYSIKGKDESGLLIEVTEGNTNTFDGILGYVPPVEGVSDGYLTGLVNVSFRNLFGTARKIEAKYFQEVKETQELEFRYFEPYFFSLPLNLNLGFLQRIQDSTYTKRNLDLKGDFLFSEDFTISLVGGYERVIPSDNPNNTIVIADSRILSSGIQLNYDNRDNIFIPTKGFNYNTFYSYGSKKIFNAAQLQQYGYQDFYSIQRYYIDIEYYYSVFPRFTTLLDLFGGEVRSEKLEESDYFRIGGLNFIRGYRPDQFLASRLVSENFELRYSVSRKGFLFTFFDAGYYFRPYDEINNYPEQSGFLYGYGLGIRLETGLGVIGVGYGLGKGDSILDGIINFGLINDF